MIAKCSICDTPFENHRQYLARSGPGILCEGCLLAGIQKSPFDQDSRAWSFVALPTERIATRFGGFGFEVVPDLMVIDEEMETE